MSKISKEQAYNIASQVCKPFDEKITKATEALHACAKKHVMDMMPKALRDLFEKNEAWFNTRTSFTFYGPGIVGGRNTNFIDPLPSKHNSSKIVIENQQKGEHLEKLFDAVDELAQQKREAVARIEVAILSLGSQKKVLEVMPELTPYFLPKEQTKALSIPIAEIQKEVKALIKKAS